MTDKPMTTSSMQPTTDRRAAIPSRDAEPTRPTGREGVTP